MLTRNPIGRARAQPFTYSFDGNQLAITFSLAEFSLNNDSLIEYMALYFHVDKNSILYVQAPV